MSSEWEPIKQNSILNDIVKEDEQPSFNSKSSADLVTDLIEKVSKELKLAHTEKYDVERAELTAALCLEAQKELAEFLAEAELLAKERKSEVESIEGEMYLHYKYEYKIDGKDNKLSDVGVQHLVAKDEKVKKAKQKQHEAESNFSKWRNLFGMLKDGHIYFRGLAKGKLDWS